MAANLTIYCLKQITDYFEFERLCNGLMSLEGYRSIEPLGGFSDKGRDAIHVSKSGETTIFAYSVREDWRAKLAEDAKKIYDHGHVCDQLIFITTANITPSQRDEAVKSIGTEFGWKLELYGVDRLQNLLDVTFPQIKHLHTGIFPPEFLAIQTQLNDSTKSDHLFISSIPEDDAIAGWLTKKLTSEGYLVWYEKLKMLGGETYPNDVDDAIRNRTFRFLGLYSRSSTRNAEIMRQRSLALNIATERKQDFVIPLDVDGICKSHLDEVAGKLKFIEFDKNWAEGLKQLLKKLNSVDCPKPLPHAKQIAAEAFLERDTLSEEQETLFSNCLRIQKIPRIIFRFRVPNEISEERLKDLESKWSYRRAGSSTFLSFHSPPLPIMNEYEITQTGGDLWQSVRWINEIKSSDLVSELIRKSLTVKCYKKGLQFCIDTNLLYFPANLVSNNRLKFIRPDGLKTHVKVQGTRTFPIGQSYLYSLAPSFSIRRDLFDDFTALIRTRVRLSDTDGRVFTNKRKIDSRRKHLSKNWWNKHWLNRILAVCRFLADEDDEKKITIGEEKQSQIVVDAIPIHATAPIGINETALSDISSERSKLLRLIDSKHSDKDLNED